jgi:hypothetical protein
MATTEIQLKRGTAARWLEVNPILKLAEIGYEKDTGKIKIGNGINTWSALGYKFDGSGTTSFKGYFPTTSDVETYQTATPGSIGDYLINGETDTFWIWDEGGSEYVDSGNAVPGITVDSEIIPGSPNPVAGGAVSNALEGKANNNHTQPMSSIDGLIDALTAKLNISDLVSTLFPLLTGVGISFEIDVNGKLKMTVSGGGGGGSLASTVVDGGGIAVTGDAVYEFALAFVDYVEIPYAANITINAGTKAPAKFKITGVTGDLEIDDIVSSRTGAVELSIVFELSGISSAVVTVPSYVTSDGAPLADNQFTIGNGNVGAKISTGFEKRGSEWELFMKGTGGSEVGLPIDISDVTDLQTNLDDLQGQIDDLVIENNEYEEYADLASFPATGQSDRIYAAIDTGFTYRWTGSTYTQIGGSTVTASSLGTLVNGTTAKSTPVDADIFSIFDSVASWITKKVTWANIKSTLKTYFDTLYVSITDRVLQVAFSDEVTPIVTGASKVSFFAPYTTTIQEIWVGLGNPQSSGSIFTVDVNINGVTMLSTKITVDNSESTSLTAATPPVISVPGWTKGDKITIDVDQVGNGTALGGKIIFRG